MASVGMLHRTIDYDRTQTNKIFLNGNAIADELPNIQLNLTTVRDASLPGIQNYFIYSSRIIGKLSLISIEKFGF